MSGYNVLIPSACQQASPELTLPVMDALQVLGHTPVVLDMASLAAMYQEMRYERHGCYEIFGFYARDMLREGKIDFGISVGLGLILEDPLKQEAHNLLEESGIPSMIYLHLRDDSAVAKLEAIHASAWRHTFFVCSTATQAETLSQSGFALTEHVAPGTSARLFYPQDQPPSTAAFSIRREDGWATEDFDVSFIGSHSVLRESLLSSLVEAGVKLAVFGEPKWKECPALHGCFRNHARYMQDVNTIYNYSRISLDLPFSESQPDDYVSCRVFDCLASGNFLLTYARPELAAHFEPGHEIATYEPGELVKCVKYYLQADVDRVAFAARGRRRVMAQHLWSHRLEQLIPRVELHLLRTAVAV
jgi:hypothetical protein